MQSRFFDGIKFYIESYRGLSSACWRGLLLNFIESICVGTFYFLSVYLVNELSFSVATAGMIVSAYGVGAIAGGYVGGKLSDIISPIVVMSISLFVQAVCYLFLIKLYSVNGLMINVMMLGMAGYSFITANHLWVLDKCQSEAQRLKALSMFSTFSNLGLSISGVLIGVTASYGFHHIFLVVGLLLAILGIYLLLVEKKKNQETIVLLSRPIKQENYQENIKPNRLMVMMVLMSVLLVGSVVSQLGAGYAIYINETFRDMGVEAVSILFTLNSILVVLFATSINQFINQYNKPIMLGISCFLIGLGMFMLACSSLFLMAIFACVIFTLGEIIYFALAQLVCYEAGEKKSKGKSLGRYRVVYGASRVVGPLVGSLIYSQYGAEVLWYVCGLIGVLCMLGFICVKKLTIDLPIQVGIIRQNNQNE